MDLFCEYCLQKVFHVAKTNKICKTRQTCFRVFLFSTRRLFNANVVYFPFFVYFVCLLQTYFGKPVFYIPLIDSKLDTTNIRPPSKLLNSIYTVYIKYIDVYTFSANNFHISMGQLLHYESLYWTMVVASRSVKVKGRCLIVFCYWYYITVVML